MDDFRNHPQHAHRHQQPSPRDLAWVARNRDLQMGTTEPLERVATHRNVHTPGEIGATAFIATGMILRIRDRRRRKSNIQDPESIVSTAARALEEQR